AEARPFLERIQDRSSLAELSLRAADAGVRAAAFERLLAQPEPGDAFLATIAIQSPDEGMAARAAERIGRRKTLREVAAKAKAAAARQAAEARLKAVETEERRPTVEAARRERAAALDAALAQGLRLAVGADAAKGEPAWAPVAAAWEAAKALHPWLEVDADEHERTLRLARARQDAERHWAAAAEAALAERLAAEQAAAARAAAELAAAAAAAAVEATVPEELRALNREAESLLALDDAGEAKFRFARLHRRWLDLAAGLPESHPERRAFGDIYHRFKDARRAAREAREAADAGKADAALAVIREAEALAEAAVESPAARVRALKDLQARFNAVGVPPKQRALRDRFRAALDRGWAPVKADQEAEDWARFARIPAAEAAIQQAEGAIALEPVESLAALKGAQAAWKQVGGLPRTHQQALWDRFKTACDAGYERLKPWFAEQDAARQAALERRLALLDEGEALADRKTVGLAGSPADLAAARAAHDRLDAIADEWRTLAPVPREHADAVWARWRALSAKVRGQRRAAWKEREAEEQTNLERKEALIRSAEQLGEDAAKALASRTGLLTAGDVRRRLDQLFQEWQGIGHVPRAAVDDLWTRFRAACDRARAVADGRVPEAVAAGDAGAEASP
ncbi:MAG: hypothetical protein RLZZ127_2196, partial [Planctomycetota bacterium]